MPEVLTLASAEIEVDLDLGPGADVVGLRERTSGVDLLFRTPWRHHAQAVRTGRSARVSFDPVGGPLETYRGGWQLLFPVAGPPRAIHGAPTTFHGEAEAATWTLVEDDVSTARLAVELYTVPVRIERTLVVDGPVLTISDTLSNLSDVDLQLDYVSHPAFSGEFLDGVVRIDTNATAYTADPDTSGSFVAAGSRHAWPDAGAADLRVLPAAGTRRMAFGFLSDFGSDTAWASITNVDLGLSARLDWDPADLPYAWFWQELNFTASYPWHRRARVIAIEPASTHSGGADRASTLRLPPLGIREIKHSLTLQRLTDSKESS